MPPVSRPPMHPDPDGVRRRARKASRGRRQGRARRGGRWLRVLLAAPLAGVAACTVAVGLLRWFDPPTSAFIVEARVAARAAGRRDFRIDRRPVPLATISPWGALAVVASEDQKFPYHAGFDVGAVRDALTDYEHGGRLRGASTISQQLAKNLFLWSGRSWLRKGLEAGFTALLEALLGKARILELYLDFAEFGPGVYGIEAASERYFGHPAATLGPDEAALLAAVLPDPKRLRVHPASAYMRERQAWIEQQMERLGGPAYLARLRRGGRARPAAR